MTTASTHTRPAAVAGLFYPAASAELARQVQAALEAAAVRAVTPAGAGRPKLLIVPHAGYAYSGDVAASAYACLKPFAAQLRRVVLLAPVHRVPVRGLAVPTADAFETPLGRVPVDHAALQAITGLPQVQRDDRPHVHEHALEVQLPFLQMLLPPGFSLLPLAVGDANPGQVAQVVDRLWGGDETLVLVSSDLSHYLPYAQAQAIDRRTVQRLTGFATDIRPNEACGARALNGALQSARQHGLKPRVLALCNSGDTAGDRTRVVGYGALAFEQPAASTDDALGTALLTRARNAISNRLGLPTRPEAPHPAMAEPGAVFVTLHDAQGALRGCIGHLEPGMSLEDSVRHNAAAAAFDDPRFAPLTAAEWPGLKLEVSLLGAAQPWPPADTEAQALARLQPGQDGVILQWRDHRATFLPQVWEQLPAPAAFLAALKRKAGLATDFWAPDIRLARYRVRSFE